MNLNFLNLFTKRDKGMAYRGWGLFSDAKDISVSMETYFKLYRQNSDLRRCVEEKQETIWKGWFKIVKGYGDEKKEIEEPRILEFLNNQKQFEEFKNIMIRDLDVWANCFIEIIKNWNNQVVWFDNLDPRTISIITDKYWNVWKYVQRVNWDMVSFDPEEILHVKDKIDMDNEVFGISKVETLVYDLMWDKEAAVTNYSFFKNNATPSQLIVLENDMDEDEINIAIWNLKKQFAWGKNKHKMSIWNWIKDIKQIGSSQKDMEFLEYRKFNSERICAVMWVPKTILNYTDWVNYSNGDTQYNKFIENTIRPFERKVESVFTELISLIAPEYRLEFTDEHINDLDERVKAVEVMLRNWLITINEAREKLWLDAFIEENANKVIISNNYTLLEDLDINISQSYNEDNNE